MMTRTSAYLVMTDTEVGVKMDKMEVVENGSRRRSERIRGRKVCASEKVILSTDEDISPLKKQIKQKLSKKANASAAAASEVSDEVGGLMRLGFQLVEVDSGNSSEKNDHLKVKGTLRIFNNYYLHCIQEEEKRCKREDEEAKKMSNGEKKKLSKRPDLKATNLMRASGKILYPGKQIGAIAGVDVGHQFFSRAEMVSVGFHSHRLNGIDYMGKDHCKENLCQYRFPIAVAIVMSGQYEDDLDILDEVIYTGQGGNDLLGNKKQIEDQKMERGNLALKNCMLDSVPVRVIRGHQSKSSYVGKLYTYDVIYNVTPSNSVTHCFVDLLG